MSESKKESARKWNAANKEKKAAYNRRWNEENPEKLKARRRAYYLANKERIQEYARQYAQRPEVKAKLKAYQQEYLRDPEKRARHQASIRKARDKERRTNVGIPPHTLSTFLRALRTLIRQAGYEIRDVRDQL